MSEAFRGSEDFGEYLKHTKGAICYIGNGEDYAPVHTFDYDFRDDIIETSVELFNFANSLHRLQSNVIIKTYGLFMKLILESGNQKEKI